MDRFNSSFTISFWDFEVTLLPLPVALSAFLIKMEKPLRSFIILLLVSIFFEICLILAEILKYFRESKVFSSMEMVSE